MRMPKNDKVEELYSCADCRHLQPIEKEGSAVPEIKCRKHDFVIGYGDMSYNYTCDSNTANRDAKIKKVINFREVEDHETK